MKDAIYLKSFAYIDDIFYSPYYKFSINIKYRLNYYDRKPNPGMLLNAIKKWNIDFKDSFFIGDSISDLNASKKAGIKFYYKEKNPLNIQLKKIINNE